MTVPAGGSSELSVGSILDGKYEILALLGAGGMGEVYKARHTHLNALRCIKVMKQHLAADEGFRARFLREARMATRVHHPNVAVVHDFEVAANGASYLVSEFIDGLTLRQWSELNGRFPVPMAVDIAIQVLAGLHEVHKNGMVHRDISSDNIMVLFDDERWIAKIIDLGIAKALEAPQNERTQVGLFVGNPRYASPEQLDDLPEGEEIDGRADLYSLGVVMYEMVVGQLPFTSRTPHGYVVKHLKQPPPRFEETLPGSRWPQGFEAVVLKALEKNRNVRYANAREFARALRPFVRTTSATIEASLQALIASATPTPPPLLSKTEAMTGPITVPADLGENDKRTEEVTSPPTMKEPAARTDDLAETAAWAKADQERSSSVWDEFIRNFPRSRRLTVARLRRDEVAAFEEAEAEGRVEAWDRFVDRWPSSTLITDAAKRRKEAVEERALRALAEIGDSPSLESLRHFVQSHPDTGAARDAQQMLDELQLLERSVADGGTAACDDFLSKYPASRHAPRIRALREESAKEEQEFEHAISSADPVLLRNYLSRHPSGKRAEGAATRLRGMEAAAFDELQRTEGTNAVSEFLSRFPDGAHAEDAKRLAKRRKEEAQMREQWKMAESADSAALYRAFALSYRGTEFEKEALKRAAALDAEKQIPQLEAEKDLDALRALQKEFADVPKVASRARKAIAKLEAAEARRREARDWDEAWREGTVTAFRLFIARYPTSSHAEEAEQAAAEAAAFDKIAGNATIPLLKVFLHDFPEGRHFAEAQIRLDELKRERAALGIEDTKAGAKNV